MTAGDGTGGTQHGDMKTGLFKESFLEDPWKDLVVGKAQSTKVSGVQEENQIPAIETHEKQSRTFYGVPSEEEEGEIVLPDDDDDVNPPPEDVIGLGDGLVETAREVS